MKDYKLFHDDCMTKLRDIPDASIHFVLCDLPYATTQCAWDSELPLKKLWKEYKRVIKDCGVIALFGAEPFSSTLRTNNLEWYKYDWIWQKNKINGHTNAKLKSINDHELVSIFSNSTTANCSPRLMKYNPQGLRVVHKTISGLHGRNEYDKNCHNFRRPSNKESIIQEHSNYPKKIITLASETNVVHPTQKPVALLEYIIKTYTDEGNIVLDNTMGSDSTGVACINTKRKFVGIEKEKEYYEIACKRIKEATRTLF